MITLQLWPFTGTGLLIPCASGFKYSNQASGMLCAHPEAEGVFVPMPSEDAVPVPHVGCSGFGLNEAEATELDSYFASLDERRSGYRITVDREKLAESAEAWVWVKCVPHGDFAAFHPLAGYEGTAVFTWENCD